MGVLESSLALTKGNAGCQDPHWYCCLSEFSLALTHAHRALLAVRILTGTDMGSQGNAGCQNPLVDTHFHYDV